MRTNFSGQRGYALTWAIMTLVIAALLAAFILPIGLSFSNRNLRSYSAERAYLTARSAAACVAANSTTVIGVGYNNYEPEYDIPALLATEGNPVKVSDIEFESDYRFGEVTSARIVYVSNSLQRATVRAEYAGESSTVSAYLGRRAETQELAPLPLLPNGEVDETALDLDQSYQFYVEIHGEDVLVTSITTYTWEVTGYTLDGGMTDETPEE